MAKPIRIVLVDDHPLIREGLRIRLDAQPDIAVVAEGADGYRAQELCRELNPDVMVLDLNMPGPPPVATIGYMKGQCSETRVLVLTAHDDEAYIRGLLAVGVAGYVLKDEAPDALVQAVRSVAYGGSWFSRPIVAKLVNADAGQGPSHPLLTERERQLLALLTQGLDNGRIAEALHLGEQTVRNYLSPLYAKLGVHSRAEAIVWAHEHGLAG